MLAISLASCSGSSAPITLSMLDGERSTGYLPNEFCGDATTVRLIAGQFIDMGKVIITNDENYLYIEYVTTPPWVLIETHVAIADSLSGIPQTKTGNPKVGQFAYDINSFIPLDNWESGTMIYIAAHAEVQKLGEDGQVLQEETAWGEGYNLPGNNWAMYFNYTVQTCIPEPTPPGNLIWAKRAGGESSADNGEGITTLSDNSTVVTGLFSSSATFGPGEPNQTILVPDGGEGWSDIFIARYNPDGTLEWAKRAGGSSFDESFGITTLSDNSIVVTGYFLGSATFGQGEINQTVLTSAGIFDVFIARYNPDGTLEWAKRAGGSDYDRGKGITTLSDNSIVVTGYFYGSATFGPGETNQTVLISAGDRDIFIAEYYPNGTLAWAKRAGGSSYEEGLGITALSDNSTVVTGGFYGSATFGPGEINQTVLSSAGYSDIFIAWYNPDGTLLWAKQAGGSSDDWGEGIAVLSDNSTVVVGAFFDSATFGPSEPSQLVLTSDGDWDIFIAKYNPNGTLAWAKRAGGSNGEVGSGITTLSDNSTVVTGGFQGSATFGSGEINQTILTSAGDWDIFIARYDSNGTLAWAKRAGGIDGDLGYGITALSDNSTVVTGGFWGSATFGPGEPNQTVLTSAGYWDIFIARFEP